MDDGTKRFLRKLAGGIVVRVVANVLLPGSGEALAHGASHAADGAAGAADAAHHGLTFGSALGEAGRFISDYLGPDGVRLHSDAAGHLFDPNTGHYYSQNDYGVRYNP